MAGLVFVIGLVLLTGCASGQVTEMVAEAEPVEIRLDNLAKNDGGVASKWDPKKGSAVVIYNGHADSCALETARARARTLTAGAEYVYHRPCDNGSRVTLPPLSATETGTVTGWGATSPVQTVSGETQVRTLAHSRMPGNKSINFRRIGSFDGCETWAMDNAWILRDFGRGQVIAAKNFEGRPQLSLYNGDRLQNLDPRIVDFACSQAKAMVQNARRSGSTYEWMLIGLGTSGEPEVIQARGETRRTASATPGPSGRAEATPVAGPWSMTRAGTVYFYQARHDLVNGNLDNGLPALAGARTALAAIQTSPGARVVLRAHTNSDGSVEYNARLSRNRLRTVRSWLFQNGVSESRIVYADGVNFEVPVFIPGTNSAEDKARSRRVEIFLVN